jgi:predicted esterase
MKKCFIAMLALVFVSQPLPLARAQQVPYLDELLTRFEEFNRLRAERQSAGANLSAIEPLRVRGEEAFRRGNITALLELLSESISSLKSRKWDEKERFLSSLAIEVNRAVIEPNAELQVSLIRMFPSNAVKAFASAPTITFEIAPLEMSGPETVSTRSSPDPVVIAQRLPVSETGAAAGRRLKMPDGAYWVTARVESGGQKAGEVKKLIYAISDFTERVQALSKRIAEIKSSTEEKVRTVAPLITTAEFQRQRLAPLKDSPSETEVIVPDQLEQIESDISELAKGNNPYAEETGEVERAYRAADGKLIPYRVYVPDGYDGKAARPLVVMLHGALGDERSYLSGLYDPAVIKGEADRRGVILACPNGRGRFSDYSGAGGEDVMEVVRAVSRDYRVDASRIYLTGHSMGGLGAWLVAAGKPDIFRAIAPVAGGGPQQKDALAALLAKMKNIPALIIHGARDGVVTPQRSRDLAEAARKAGLKVEYLEAAETDHMTVVAATFPMVMDFFEKQSKMGSEK